MLSTNIDDIRQRVYNGKERLIMNKVLTAFRFTRSATNPFEIGDVIDFKFEDLTYENSEYIGQLSPTDHKDPNPLLYFFIPEQGEDIEKRLRIRLKAIQDFEFKTLVNGNSIK